MNSSISTVIKIRPSLEPLVDGQLRVFFFLVVEGVGGGGVFTVALTLYSYFNYTVQGVTEWDLRASSLRYVK